MTFGRRIIAGAGVCLVASALVAVGWWRTRSLARDARPSVHLQPVVSDGRPLTEWFYADGIINSGNSQLGGSGQGSPSISREWVVILNLSKKNAKASATYYFETRPPRTVTRSLPAGSSYIVSHELGDVVPQGELYGVRVQSSEPVVVQTTRGEFEGSNPVTKTMASFVAHPGPLGVRETRWAYADGLVLSSNSPLEEREWISILNPRAGRDANVKIRFMQKGAEESHQVLVPSERVRSVDLMQLKTFPKNRLSGVVVDSDVPVIVEQIRRAYNRGNPAVVSMWACLAHPIGDQGAP
jgi:hypothetical protein